MPEKREKCVHGNKDEKRRSPFHYGLFLYRNVFIYVMGGVLVWWGAYLPVFHQGFVVRCTKDFVVQKVTTTFFEMLPALARICFKRDSTTNPLLCAQKRPNGRLTHRWISVTEKQLQPRLRYIAASAFVRRGKKCGLLCCTKLRDVSCVVSSSGKPSAD